MPNTLNLVITIAFSYVRKNLSLLLLSSFQVLTFFQLKPQVAKSFTIIINTPLVFNNYLMLFVVLKKLSVYQIKLNARNLQLFTRKWIYCILLIKLRRIVLLIIVLLLICLIGCPLTFLGLILILSSKLLYFLFLLVVLKQLYIVG